jgi:D-sedoheptulose 7-phosphate isomerase
MNSINLLNQKIKVLENLLISLVVQQGETFSECAELFVDTLRNGNTIYWCGNGGSAAESSHLAVELIGRFKDNRRPLPSISLNSDASAITCIANDFGYSQIFSRQLEGLAKSGDLLITLSTSGQSENIIEVLNKARDLRIESIALLGKGGGSAASIATKTIIIDSSETARIQELHLLIGHTLCEYAEAQIFSER